MALVKATLKSGIKALMDNPPATAALAATQWGLAYDAYAKLGQANGIPGVITPANAQAFTAIVLPLFNAGNSPAPAAATIFGAAINAYWFIPPVVFGTGVVTAVTGLAAMSTMFDNTYSSSDAAADNIATFMDTCTKTVTVTFTLPPGVFLLA